MKQVVDSEPKFVYSEYGQMPYSFRENIYELILENCNYFIGSADVHIFFSDNVNRDCDPVLLLALENKICRIKEPKKKRMIKQ